MYLAHHELKSDFIISVIIIIIDIIINIIIVAIIVVVVVVVVMSSGLVQGVGQGSDVSASAHTCSYMFRRETIILSSTLSLLLL